MLVRVETSRVGPARLPSAASWRGSSSFAYRIHWRSGRSGGDDAHLSENAREFVWGERVTRLEIYNDFPARFRLGQEALSVRTWQRKRAFLSIGHASPERAGPRKHRRLLA